MVRISYVFSKLSLDKRLLCVFWYNTPFSFVFPAELGTPLQEYLDKTFPDGVVKVVKLKERSGLIRAKIAGADAATGEVVIFLDAHCEVTPGW